MASTAAAQGTSLPDLSTLAARMPCLVWPEDWARLDADTQAALTAGGCKLAVTAEVAVVEALEATPAPAARYIAGEWYLQPLAKPSTNPTGSRTLALKLVKLIANDADTWELEEVFRLEPTLTYNLLRLVNSAGMGSSRRIDNLAQAILFLGRRQLKRWLNLMLFAAQKDDPRAAMLLARVAVRARTCELLAKEAGLDRDTQESAFLVGMFSLLGVMFSVTLPELLKPLNLDPAMGAALVAQEGELGRVLACALALEAGNGQAEPLIDALLPPATDTGPLLVDAHLWMLSLNSGNGEPAHG